MGFCVQLQILLPEAHPPPARLTEKSDLATPLDRKGISEIYFSGKAAFWYGWSAYLRELSAADARVLILFPRNGGDLD